jgi:hypothetical protein
MTHPSAEPPAEDSEPLARQLLQQAQVIARLRRDLDQFANDATDTIADLLVRLEYLESRAGATATSPAPWCWRDLGPHARTELMDQLDTWTAWLRHRYPLARKIPACWAQHPELVEELTGLWLAWQGAYQQPDPPLTAAADWHDRWLPGLLHRLEHGPFALDCSETHAARPPAAYAEARDATSPIPKVAANGATTGGSDPSS